MQDGSPLPCTRRHPGAGVWMHGRWGVQGVLLRCRRRLRQRIVGRGSAGMQSGAGEGACSEPNGSARHPMLGDRGAPLRRHQKPVQRRLAGGLDGSVYKRLGASASLRVRIGAGRPARAPRRTRPAPPSSRCACGVQEHAGHRTRASRLQPIRVFRRPLRDPRRAVSQLALAGAPFDRVSATSGARAGSSCALQNRPCSSRSDSVKAVAGDRDGRRRPAQARGEARGEQPTGGAAAGRGLAPAHEGRERGSVAPVLAREERGGRHVPRDRHPPSLAARRGSGDRARSALRHAPDAGHHRRGASACARLRRRSWIPTCAQCSKRSRAARTTSCSQSISTRSCARSGSKWLRW